MAAVTATIAAIGAAAAIGGTAYSIYNSQQQSGIQGQIATNQAFVGKLQSVGATIQNQATNRMVETQTSILDAQARQAQLGIRTNKQVIEQQLSLEDLKQQGNQLNRDFNQVGRDATVQLEGFNKQNDVLNRSSDVVDTQNEALSRQLQFLQARRATRDAVRAGVTAQSSALSQGVNRGQGTDSSASVGNRANVQGKVSTAVSDANQNRLFQTTAGDLATQKRLLGVQSRELGVNARQVNYGLALGRFDLAENQFGINDQQFGINKNISNIYLGAQDANSALVSESAGLNKQLVSQNAQSQNELLAIQKMIYELGGQNNLLSASAASYGGLSNLGSGISSLGNSFINNAGTINKISQENILPPSGNGDVFQWNT